MSKKKNKKTGLAEQPATTPTPEKKADSVESKVIAKKVVDLQNKYRVAMKTKQELTQKLRVLDEEITKMAGAYQALMELKTELTKDVTPPKDENPDTPADTTPKEKAKDAVSEEEQKETEEGKEEEKAPEKEEEEKK